MVPVVARVLRMEFEIVPTLIRSLEHGPHEGPAAFDYPIVSVHRLLEHIHVGSFMKSIGSAEVDHRLERWRCLSRQKQKRCDSLAPIGRIKSDFLLLPFIGLLDRLHHSMQRHLVVSIETFVHAEYLIGNRLFRAVVSYFERNRTSGFSVLTGQVVLGAAKSKISRAFERSSGVRTVKHVSRLIPGAAQDIVFARPLFVQGPLL